MINFVYGKMSNTKLCCITDMIADDCKNGIRSFLIVPEQFAVHSERHMLRALPPSAQLTLEIINFSRLYNRVCREYGGIEYNYVTKPLRYAMMWQNLRELTPLLSVYGKIANDTDSLCDMMLSATNEFKVCGISAPDLEKAADTLGDQPLSHKLRDLALIYSSYDNLISHAFSDSADDISKLYDVLKDYDFFSGTNVYIDSFTSFTAVEHKIIEKIFETAKNVTVTIPLDAPQQKSLYNKSIIDCEERLIKSAEKYGDINRIILSADKDEQHPDISLLANNLWTSADTSKTRKGNISEAVQLIKCASPYAEAEAAAATVLSLLRDGKRCRDIVVLMRNAEQYRGIIEPAFERCDIPYHFSEKTDLSSTPIVKFIISALRIGIYNWRTGDVISHLKCALYDAPTQDIDLFEQYITTWQVRGSRFTSGEFTMNPDGYVEKPSERADNILIAANRVRALLCDSLLTLFDDIEKSDNTADKIRAIYGFICRSGAKKQIDALAKKEADRGNVRTAEEYSKLFAFTCDSLAALTEAIEADEGFCADLSIAELCELLTVYFSKSDVGSIPTSADQVIIGSASMMRAGNPKCVLMLGMCEGVFPAPVSDSGILTFTEKDILSGLNVNLSGSMDLVASDELMYVQRSVESASERLYMFCHTNSTDGRKTAPSLPFLMAEKLFEQNVKIFDGKDLLALTPSLRASLQYLNKITDTNLRTALLDCIKKDEKLSMLVNEERSDISNTVCSVSDETVSDIFGQTLYLTQSRIDKFVNCNFSYYCTYVLNLREEHISRFKANDIGTFVHYILEKLLSEIVSEDGFSKDITKDKISKMTAKVVDDYIALINPPGMPIIARLGHLYDRLYKLSLLLICNIIEEFRHSSFRPEFFELKMDGKGENPSAREFLLNDGKKIIFSGTVDRVDLFKKDGKVYIRVVDYKTGTKQFSLEDIEHGLNIQMLLYLFALKNNKNNAFSERIGSNETEAAGVVYLSSSSPAIDISDYQDEGSVFEAAQRQLDRSGLFLDDEDILLAMNDQISPDFLGGIKRKADGTITGKALASSSLFKSLEGDIERVIMRIADEMLSGKADASPLNYKKNDPCKYCEMKPICRISDSAERR